MGSRVGSITVGGLASGLNTQDLITKLVDADRGPLNALTQRRTDESTQLSIFQDINTKTLALRDALSSLDNLNSLGTGPSAQEEFLRMTASSSNASIATASVDGTAAPGSVNLRVTQIASAARQVSNQGYARLSDTVGTGNFQITVNGKSKTIPFDGSNNTVQGFIDAINNSGLDVTAFTLNDGSATPLRIVIQGNSTGAANDVVLTNGLVGGSPQSPTFTETQTAKDSIVVLDPDNTGSGITVHSATKTFSNLLPGLSVDVVATNNLSNPSDNVTITIAPDQNALVSEIHGIADAFNAVVGAVNQQFKIDPATNRGGPLIGDSTLSSLQQRLEAVLASPEGSGSITQSAQIGLGLDTNGQITIDDTQLRSALASDLSGVRSFFSGAGSFSDQLRGVAQSFVDPVEGLLTTRVSGTTGLISSLDQQIADENNRLNQIQDSLVQQFTALEQSVSALQLQGSFLTSFLGLQGPQSQQTGPGRTGG
jgi:flagellar hook-associated protein 2